MDERIDAVQRRIAGRAEIITMAGGFPAAELFPREELTRAFEQSLSARGDPALQYGWPEGSGALRSWVAARLRARGAPIDASDVVITSGAQQAIAIASEILLARGDAVLVDEQTYPAALDLFRMRGAIPVCDARDGRVRAHYVMPGVSNPRGTGQSPVGHARVLSRGLPFIADEAYAELRFRGVERPLIADARDRAWHIGTFSKTLAPGLRVGYLIPPPPDRARALEIKRAADLQAPSMSQAVLEAFLRIDDFDARLAHARRFYEARAGLMATAIRRFLPSGHFATPEGGFSIFVETEATGDDAAFLALAAEEGVSFDPGSQFHTLLVGARLSFRLCFSALDPGLYDEAIRRLARALARWARCGVRETTNGCGPVGTG